MGKKQLLIMRYKSSKNPHIGKDLNVRGKNKKEKLAGIFNSFQKTGVCNNSALIGTNVLGNQEMSCYSQTHRRMWMSFLSMRRFL